MKLIIGMGIFIAALIVLSIHFDILAKNAQRQLPQNEVIFTSPTPTLIPTFTPEQQTNEPTVNPDPPVLCNVSPNCGGGTTPLKQSECNNSTCCQIGNKWIFYKDKSQCAQDQNTQNNLPSLNQQVNQQRELNNANAAKANACMLAAKDKSDSCTSICDTTVFTDNNGFEDCLNACTATFESDLHSCTP